MKKIRFFVATVLVVLLALFTSGCASAYDIAVKNGFSGTESQWLESLKGKDGSDGHDITIGEIYTYAQQNGFEGTYLDFLGEYLSFEKGPNYEEAVTKGLLSTVEVYCKFDQIGYLGQSNFMQGGSGVVFKLNKEAGTAYIITNYHVLYSEKSSSGKISSDISVVPYGGEMISATYIGGTPTFDIAVLKAEGLTTDFIKAATVNTQNATVGQTAIAVGNPSGAGISATLGIVSVDSENIVMPAIDNPRAEVNMRVLRIDAAVNSGNSGGGLFNDDGELIGIVNAKSGEVDIENVGYAIPSSIAVAVAENIIRNGAFVRGLAGITVKSENIRAYLDENNRARISETVVIDAVSGASDGKLEKGDVITSVKVFETETEVVRSFNVVDALLMASPNDEVTFTVLRNGKKLTVNVTLQK